MPAIPFPTITPSAVEVVPYAAQVASRSPSSLQAQVQDRGGRQYRIVVRFERMDRTAAGLVCAFLAALDGMAGTFELDLTPHCPGVSPAPGVREFRLAGSDVGWTSKGCVEFACQFAAQEEVGA